MPYHFLVMSSHETRLWDIIDKERGKAWEGKFAGNIRGWKGNSFPSLFGIISVIYYAGFCKWRLQSSPSHSLEPSCPFLLLAHRVCEQDKLPFFLK